MKYVIFIPDGASDYPVDELDGKTPLMVANTPNIDKLAKGGFGGFTNNVPDAYTPGSDVANMSIASEYYILWCCWDSFTARFKWSTASVVICRIISENAHIGNIRTRSVLVWNIICESSKSSLCQFIDVWCVCNHQRSFSV